MASPDSSVTRAIGMGLREKGHLAFGLGAQEDTLFRQAYDRAITFFDQDSGFKERYDSDVVGYSATISDVQFKENINPIESALFKVQQLRGVEFDWKTDYNDRGHDIGFIAQEVEGVKGLEPFVSEHNNIITDKPAKVVHYDKVVALLVEAVKEQQTQIEELKSEVQELRDGSSE